MTSIRPYTSILLIPFRVLPLSALKLFLIFGPLLVALTVVLPASVSEKAKTNVFIDNQHPRRDMNGEILDVHDGALEPFQGKFYLYGTHYGKTNGLGKENFFVCYSSPDLMHWKFEGKILSGPPRTYYRPHVKYNRATRKYVLWYNADNEYGVATANRPEGPFTIINPNVPLKFSEQGVGDFDLFVDGGKGYITYTAYITKPMETHAVEHPEHHVIVVERLARDFLSSTGETSGFVAGNVESPALFRRGNTYYLLFDNTCAFCKEGSGIRVYRSMNPLGPYTYDNNINIANSQSADGKSWTRPGTGRGNAIVHAQQLGVAEVQTATGKVYMWMGDRWHSTPDSVKGHDFQVWLPIIFQGKNIRPFKGLTDWNIPGVLIHSEPQPKHSEEKALPDSNMQQ